MPNMNAVRKFLCVPNR